MFFSISSLLCVPRWQRLQRWWRRRLCRLTAAATSRSSLSAAVCHLSSPPTPRAVVALSQNQILQFHFQPNDRALTEVQTDGWASGADGRADGWADRRRAAEQVDGRANGNGMEFSQKRCSNALFPICGKYLFCYMLCRRRNSGNTQTFLSPPLLWGFTSRFCDSNLRTDREPVSSAFCHVQTFQIRIFI